MPEPLDLHQAATILRGHGGVGTTQDDRRLAAARVLYELDDEFRCRVWSRKLLDALDGGQVDDITRARRGLERLLDGQRQLSWTTIGTSRASGIAVISHEIAELR